MSTQNENAGSKSLMKKTKVELVDIILRKDDIEKQLRKEKADVELDFNKAKETIAKKDTVIDNLNKDVKIKDSAVIAERNCNTKLQSSVNELTNKNTELVSRNKKLVTYTFIEGIIIVGLTILYFCL